MKSGALEAYGAAYTLQEMLTIRVRRRRWPIKAYEKIVSGEKYPGTGYPESQSTAQRIAGLGLDIVVQEDGDEVDMQGV